MSDWTERQKARRCLQKETVTQVEQVEEVEEVEEMEQVKLGHSSRWSFEPVYLPKLTPGNKQ